MLPLVFDPQHIKAGLVGHGAALDRRAAFLAGAGVEARLLPENPADDALEPLTVLFVAGLPDAAARALAGRARAQGVLVNVEDRPDLCDFHVPALVRRGDLLLTASTGGKAPGLASALRGALTGQFGPEWAERLKDIAAARAHWRAEGLDAAKVSENTRALLAQRGWL